MFHAVYFVLTLAATTLAESLSPRLRSYAFNITDFQGHLMDLTDGNPQPFTPVQSFTPANTTNQEWALISTMDARQLFEIVNVDSNAILSHTTALLKTPGPAIHAQIVGSNQTLFWRLEDTPKGTRLLDADTGLALTAWPAAGGPSSPLTLEYPDPKNKRQVFRLRCVRGWSIPGPC
ncbi:hypothetical protein FB451DRAFT_1248933 [Mycena latifolia]|nr:hypothetical protein FB451DRAFT_1248933 [Mycena latifolia]